VSGARPVFTDAVLRLDDRFAVATSLAAQWQRAGEGGLGDQDVTVIAHAL
jgi:hypothetical protein